VEQAGARADFFPTREQHMSVIAQNADAGPLERSSAVTPRRSWKDILFGTYRSISEDRVFAVAAGVAFYGLLAIFPAIGAVVSLYGLVADGATISHTLDSVSALLPGGAIEVMGDQIQRVASAGGGTLSFSFLLGLAIAVWGANAGVKALFDAINVAYGAQEERSFFKLNLISLAFTACAIGFILLALGSIVVLPISFHYLGLDTALEQVLRLGRWPLIWLVVALGLAVLYRFGPTDSLDPKWRWITWGSASASLLWLAASVLFSWYAANFGNYNKTYGSLGAAIGFMTWMWISAAVFIMGAEFNAEIEKAVGEPHAQRPKNAERETRGA
jgi:membrane protein